MFTYTSLKLRTSRWIFFSSFQYSCSVLRVFVLRGNVSLKQAQT
jgi:hypothetical protein